MTQSLVTPLPLLVATPSAARAARRTRTIGVTAAVVGIAGLFGGLWPFLFLNEVARQISLTDSRELPWHIAVVAARATLAGAFGLLGFYGLRLLAQTARGATADVKPRLLDNLRKLRWVLGACLCLSIASCVAALSSTESGSGRYGSGEADRWTTHDTEVVMLTLYAACGVACGVAGRNVRRALAEFAEPDLDERQDRGFEVALPAAAVIPTPAVRSNASPLPVEALPAPPSDAVHTLPTSAVVALPRGASSHSWRPSGVLDSGYEGHRDLRTLLNALAITGIVFFAARLPFALESYSWLRQSSVLSSPSMNAPPNFSLQRQATTPPELEAIFAAREMSALLLHAVGLWWIGWGVVCLVRGPGLHRLAVAMAWATVGLAVAFAAANVYASLEVRRLNGGLSRWREPDMLAGSVSPQVVGLVYPAFLLLALTRPGVKLLFNYGSEAEEA